MKKNKISICVATVSNTSEKFKQIAGMNLIIFDSGTLEKVILRPFSLEDMNKFYKWNFENSGKELISSNYNYFLEYMLDDDCEILQYISTDDISKIEPSSEKVVKLHNESLEKFKKQHNLKFTII